MNSPKISVIVPAYNIENYIKKCLASILCQTYNNIEIIVVNDGSKDNTLDVINEVASSDERVIVIHQQNTGVSAARQNGISKASGEFIGFVDGDDFIEPDMYENLIPEIIENNADIAHCGYKKVFEKKPTEYYYNTGKKLIQSNKKGLKDLLTGEFVEPGLCNKLYRRSLFDKINFEKINDIKNNEDLLLNFYLFSNAEKSVYHDFCPYNYVYRADSASNTKLNEHQLFDPLKVITEICNCVKNNEELFSIAYSRKTRQYIRISTANVKGNKVLKKKCRKTLSVFRKMVKKVVLSPFISTKLKIMSIWAALSPFTYRVVHTLHNKIKYKQEDII